MILLRLSTDVKGVMVEIEGEANTLDEIKEAWESFVLATYQVENEHQPATIHINQMACSPVQEVL